jgi:hypothetical protein
MLYMRVGGRITYYAALIRPSVVMVKRRLLLDHRLSSLEFICVLSNVHLTQFALFVNC